MRAAVFVKGNEHLLLEDVNPADPGPREVVVELNASGICSTDLSVQCRKMFKTLVGASIPQQQGRRSRKDSIAATRGDTITLNRMSDGLG